jgi:TRAP-type C4-dicarboxylate transport system permease small subunit
MTRYAALVASVMGHIAGWNYIACAVFITADVLGRSFLGVSSSATVELTGYSLAFGIAWALAHTLARRAHIRVDVLLNHFPAKVRAPLHLASLLLLLGFAIFCAWAAWELVDETMLFDAHDNSALHLPLVIPQGLWLFGLVAFVLMILVLVAGSVAALLRGDWAALDALLGSRTLEDETEEALEAAAMAHEGEAPR